MKDEFDVAGEVSTFGTNAYGEPAKEDSEIVRRVRAAGAVVIGKTHMPELGAFPWTESPTWGVTRNPWSSGTAPAAPAAAAQPRLPPASSARRWRATEADRSAFRRPTAALFGLKTQRGRVPLAPHLDAWHGLVVNGVLARSVRDTALFYDAIADGPADPGAPEVPPSSFLEALGQVAERTGPERARGRRCGSRSRPSCRRRR